MSTFALRNLQISVLKWYNYLYRREASALLYFFGFLTVLILSFLYPSLEPMLFVITGVIAVSVTVAFVMKVRTSSREMKINAGRHQDKEVQQT